MKRTAIRSGASASSGFVVTVSLSSRLANRTLVIRTDQANDGRFAQQLRGHQAGAAEVCLREVGPDTLASSGTRRAGWPGTGSPSVRWPGREVRAGEICPGQIDKAAAVAECCGAKVQEPVPSSTGPKITICPESINGCH